MSTPLVITQLLLTKAEFEAQIVKPAQAEAGGQWETKVKNTLKAELKRRGVAYKELADRQDAIGVSKTEPNIRNKLARGNFTCSCFR